MTLMLGYNSLTSTKNKVASHFGGSSRHQVIDGEIIEVIKKIPDVKLGKNNFLKQKGNVNADQLKEKNKRIYKLNKSKVRNKCNALCRLEMSKEFLAFYTITFPAGLSDIKCYKLFNVWLTRCRRDAGLNTYMWVAERQKNGTIHFHLLTNDYMPIQNVNRFMAISINRELKKGLDGLEEVDIDKYNGVDVKRVGKKRNSIKSYLTKYVTKNNIEFYRLPWHCSRNISRLFTSINFEKEESERYLEKLPTDRNKYIEYSNEYIKVKGFKFNPPESLYEELDSVNESIIKM